MTSEPCRRGPGPFQWNAGGWFGSQLGGTLWLLVGAGFFAAVAPLAVAAVWLVCFAAANAVGCWLWQRRDRLLPHTAVQVLLLTCSLCSAVALLTLDLVKPAGAALASDGPRHLALLVIPGLMALFYLRERLARASSTQLPPQG